LRKSYSRRQQAPAQYYNRQTFVSQKISLRPTGCPLAAASAGNACQNTTDLAREADGCTGVLGERLIEIAFQSVKTTDCMAQYNVSV
jgi:hypothetical protein